MAAAGRPAARSEGGAAVRIRGVDAEGFRLGVREVRGAPVEGYETVQARPFENRFLLERVPDYYERLKHSYDESFYEQEVLGDYLNCRAGGSITRSSGPGMWRRWRSIEGRRCCGRWISMWTRCVRWWRRWTEKR